VLVVVPEKQDASLEDLYSEASRHGIGLIVATKADDYKTWKFEVDAETRQPDPAELDEFIESQISKANRMSLRKWLKS